MKKKIGIILLFAAAACAAFAAAFTHSGELGVNPFDRSFTFENLSFAVKDKTGSSFVIDRSMRRIVKLRPDGTLDETDDEVTVTQPGSRLTGRGFETNLKTKEYTFKSQVRSIYEPRSAR